MKTLPLLLLPFALLAQRETVYEEYPAFELANDKIALTVTRVGAAMPKLVLRDDPEQFNPMWEPIRLAREAGGQRVGRPGGHFVCVDGFGPASAEERAAGLSSHGEAAALRMEVVSAEKAGAVAAVTMRSTLPILQEVFTRTCRIVDGENVVYVESELENLLGFDRPAVWAEHATIGSPFLAPEVTVVDLSAGPSQTRPYSPERGGRRRLAGGVDFTWPMAPLRGGGLVDLRAAPANPDSGDHTTSLMDPNRRLAFVTALNLQKRLLLGYLFRREEYPWLQTWENYPPNLKMARGIEFSTQPYDVPRRESISLGRLFGAPTYRWLPAKSKIGSAFLIFYTRVPEGFHKVDDVQLAGGRIVIADKAAGLRVELAASGGL